MRPIHNRRAAAAAASVAVLAALVAGCSSGGGNTDSARRGDLAADAGAAEAPSPADAKGVRSAGQPDYASLSDATKAGRPAVQTRAIIATGTVTLVDKDLGRVRNEIDRLLGR
jgi:hypothetical protein